MAYNSKRHTVSFGGVTAKVPAVNRGSALVQIEHLVKRFGKAFLLDEESGDYMAEQFSVTEITETT